jgi:hypothetical protein
MEKIIIDLEAKTDKALKGIDKVADSVKDLNKSVTDGNKETEKSLKGVESASKDVAGGIKAIGTTLKAIGIGLLISSLATLKELFSQNQKTVDLFNTVFETTSIVVSQVITAFTDIYDVLTQSTDSFSSLGKVVNSLMTVTLAPFKLTFYGITLAVQAAQLAWEESFFGDKDPSTIKELNLAILETKQNILDVAKETVNAGVEYVDNFVGAWSEIGNVGKVIVKELGEVSVSAAIDTAKANVELQKSAELAAARQGLFFEKFDRQAEKLRQIRDDETKSIEERKQANDALLIKIDSAESAMLSQAQMQLALADANLKKDKENVEFQTARIEALRELAGVEAQIEGIRSEQKSNALALDRESLELTNSQKEADAELNANKNQFEAEQIENDLARLERQKLLNEEETKSEEKRLIDKRNLYKKGTIAFQEAQNQLDAYQQASGQKQIQIDKQIAKEKEKTVFQSLGAIAGLLGSNSKFGKALAVTQAIRDTYTGANKALAQGGIFGFIGAAGIIASGFANVKQITSSQEPPKPSFATGGGGGSSSVSTPATPQVPSLPPAFNVVGASGTNQLAEAIGSQSQQPVQAYVVSNDVTTAQEMERNIVKGASIG